MGMLLEDHTPRWLAKAQPASRCPRKKTARRKGGRSRNGPVRGRYRKLALSEPQARPRSAHGAAVGDVLAQAGEHVAGRRRTIRRRGRIRRRRRYRRCRCCSTGAGCGSGWCRRSAGPVARRDLHRPWPKLSTTCVPAKVRTRASLPLKLRLPSVWSARASKAGFGRGVGDHPGLARLQVHRVQGDAAPVELPLEYRSMA